MYLLMAECRKSHDHGSLHDYASVSYGSGLSVAAGSNHREVVDPKSWCDIAMGPHQCERRESCLVQHPVENILLRQGVAAAAVYASFAAAASPQARLGRDPSTKGCECWSPLASAVLGLFFYFSLARSG